MTDVNDELPVFNKASITVPVPEDVGTDTPLPGLSLEVSRILSFDWSRGITGLEYWVMIG